MTDGSGYPTNPTFDECNCFVARYHRDAEDEEQARKIHELLLAMDGPNGLTAFAEVVLELREGGLFRAEGGGFFDGQEFGSFMSQHRWSDPVAAHDLGQQLDFLHQENEEQERAFAH